MRGQPRYLSLKWDFSYVVWFRVVFSFSWGILFHFFFRLRMLDGVRFQYSQVFVSFLFSKRSDFSWFGSSISLAICHFLLFMAHFSMPNSIPISWLYILAASIRVPNAFSFLANTFMSMYIRYLVGDRSRGRPESSFTIASTLRCRGGCYSFPWIAPLYPWYVPYIVES